MSYSPWLSQLLVQLLIDLGSHDFLLHCIHMAVLAQAGLLSCDNDPSKSPCTRKIS